MTIEELIKNLEYTEKKHRNDTVNTFDTDISMMCTDILKVLKNCIYIPKGATNGDIVKAVFPNIDTNFSNVIDLKMWWNAKYKTERNNKE